VANFSPDFCSHVHSARSSLDHNASSLRFPTHRPSRRERGASMCDRCAPRLRLAGRLDRPPGNKR